MPTAASISAIQRVYVAYYGRPADTIGLDYWATRLDAANGNLSTIINAFGTSAEATARFAGQSTATMINNLYLQMFNRAAEPAGLSWWVQQVTSGNYTVATVMLAVLAGAQGADATVIAGKLASAALYTAAMDTTAEILAYQGTTAADAGRAFLASVGATAVTAAAADAAVATMVAGAVVPVTPMTLTLTTGADILTGGAGDDTFNAGEAAGVATWTVGDTLNGGAGNDTLTIVQTAAIAAVPVGFVATSIETVNVTSGGAIAMNTTTGFADTTTLNTNTSGAAQTITAAATQNLTATAALLAANNVAVNGGNNITINATGVTTGTNTVGATTAAAGTVAVNVTNSTGGTTTGAIAVTGGSTVTVTSKAANAVNTTVVQSTVAVTGNANTTAVTVNQDATATAAATVVGKTAGAVTIADVNAASGTAAGKIDTVSLKSYGNSTINSGALATLNLSGTGGTLGVTAGALTTPLVSALALNVNGLTGAANAITLDVDYKTLNLASSTAASTIADIIGTGVTTLNISGDALLTLTAQTLAVAKTITVTNTAGASLGTALATDVLFTGGAGADTISIGATTKAINMGAGNDVVILSSAALGAGGTLNGGDGTDTLVANTNGSSFIADPAFGGFEVLRVAGAAAQGSHNANGFTALEIGVLAGAATFTNVASNVGLTVLDAPTAATTVTLANATGTADVFNLTLKSAAGINANSITLAGIETVNITVTDTNTTAHTDALTLVATAAKTVTVTGNAGLTLTNTGNVAITSFNASGVSGTAANAAALAVTFTSANVTVGENIAITGGSGDDVLTGGALTNDTIIGGAGNDTLVYTGGTDIFTGGAGADIFGLGAVGTSSSYLTITDASATDTINMTAITNGVLNAGTGAMTAAQILAAKVTLGAGATFTQYLNQAAIGDGGTANALFTWFQFSGDTYAVVDNAAAVTFTSGTDAVVKLTGLINLGTSSIAGEILTLA